MPGPFLNQVHQDTYLTDISVAYQQEEKAFAWKRAFAAIPVKKQSDKVPIFNQSDWMRDHVKRRAPGAHFSRYGYDIGSTTYNCDGWGLEHPVPLETIANADNPIRPVESGIAWLNQQFNIHMELTWAVDNFVTGKWTSTNCEKTGVASGSESGNNVVRWNDYTNSRPIYDIVTIGRPLFLATNGVMPNVFVCQFNVDAALKGHPDVKALYKVNNADSVSDEMMARILHVDEYIVSNAVYDSADEGATASMGSICGQNAAYFYKPKVPSTLTPASGYSFVHKGGEGQGGTGNAEGVSIAQYYEPQTNSQILQGQIFADSKQIAASMGVIWVGITA